jgi:putative pyoverdin transport system ATP-binding/permease protein
MDVAERENLKTGHRLALAALWAGPLATVTCVLAAHLANAVLRPEAYWEAPPSISRTIVHDEIGIPFGIAMLPTALLILVGMLTVISTYWKLLARRRRFAVLLSAITFCEVLAVVGMIMLSQYRTEEWQLQHDIGSYILFFGHAMGITLLGIMVSLPGVVDLPTTSGSIRWVPRAAWGVFVISVIYGILYFGGKFLSGDTFFWQRLFLAVWEVILLTSFVWFLWRHTGFVLTMRTATGLEQNPAAAAPEATHKADAMVVDRRLLASLVRFLWQHAPVRLKYLLIALALVAGLTRDMVMVVINQAAGSAPAHALQVWLPLFVLILAGFVAASYSYQVMTTAVTTEVINRVRARLIDKLLAVQPTVVESYERGTLYHIMTTDVAIVAGTTTTLLSLLPLFVFLTVAIPQLFYYSAVAGLLSVLVMLGGVLVYYRQQQSMASLGMDARKLEVTYFENVSELLDGHRELRLNQARRGDFMAALTRGLAQLRHALISVSKIYETGEAGVSLLKFVLLSGIVFLVPALFQTDARVTFSVLTLVLFCMNPFEQLVSSYPTIIGSMVSYLRIEDLDTHLKTLAKDGDTAGSGEPFQSLVLKGVTASHGPEGAQGFVLGPIDLDIRRGDIVFLVGDNGSGKTTLLNLIAGLHDPKSGEITLNGRPLEKRGMGSYRAGISAIFAKYHVFRTLFGLGHIHDRDVSATIIKVNLSGQTGVIKGVFTRMELSAGQKRRLALAVSLLENRDILILDEFVQDQDPNQRAFLFEQLLPELKEKGKTIILSTHDLAWTKACDKLVRLENGKIASITASDVRQRA